MNKKTFGIVGCGFLGNIVADAYNLGLLEDYELIGVSGIPMEAAAATSVKCDCACCADVDALLAMKPDYIVETASVECVRANAVKILESGVNLQFLEQYLPRILKETSFLWDYLPAESAVILEDPDRTREVLEFAEGERQEDFKVRLERVESL